MDGDLRDVRTSPESPAPWPDELSNPSFRCCSLQLPLLIIISPGTGLIARSTHLFHWAEEHRRLPSNSTSHPSSWLLAPDFPCDATHCSRLTRIYTCDVCASVKLQLSLASSKAPDSTPRGRSRPCHRAISRLTPASRSGKPNTSKKAMRRVVSHDVRRNGALGRR